MGTAARSNCLLAAVVFAALANPAWAQFPGGGFPRGDRGPRTQADRPVQRGPTEMRRDFAADAIGRVEHRLELLQEDLRLQPDQDNAWRAYAGKVRAYAADLARERAQPMRTSDGGTNALVQIDRLVNIERNRLTAMEDIASVARVFYDGLTPEQRILADARMAAIIPMAGGAGEPVPPEPRRRQGYEREAPIMHPGERR